MALNEMALNEPCPEGSGRIYQGAPSAGNGNPAPDPVQTALRLAAVLLPSVWQPLAGLEPTGCSFPAEARPAPAEHATLNPRAQIQRWSSRLTRLLAALGLATTVAEAGPLPQSAGDPTRLPAPLALPLTALWQRETGALPLSTWRAPLTKDVLLLPSAHAVEAVDPRTGAVKWRAELPFSPRSATLDSGWLWVGGAADGSGAVDLVALVPETGSERCRLSAGGVFTAPIPWPGPSVAASPDRFLVASTHRLLAIAIPDGKIVWQVDFPRRADGFPGGPGLSSPALLGDLVVVGTADGFVHAFAASTGERRWAIALGRPIHSGVASDGRLAIFTAGSWLLACDASGRERWRQGLRGDASFATPVVDRGVVYVATGTGGAVIAVDAPTGRRLWRTALGAQVVSRPAIARDHVVVGDLSNQLSVLRQADGAVVGQWSLGEGGGIYRSDPIFAGEVVGVGSTSGVFHVFAAAPVLAAAPAVTPPLAAAPNPFRATTTLSISAAAAPAQGTSLQIYDVEGRLVRVLAHPTAGGVEWDGRNGAGVRVGAGTYFARLKGAPRGIKIERLP